MNNFSKQYLRLHLIHYGSFDGIENSKVYSSLYKEFNRQRKILEFTDFLYNYVGYSDDSYLSATNRFKLRKEISENYDNHNYFRSQCLNHGMTRTSEIVDYFNHKDVLGLGRECISMKASEYSFKGFRNFLFTNKEIVDVFCSGAEICGIPGLDLSYKEFKSKFRGIGFDDFIKSLGGLSTDKFIRFIEAKKAKMTPFGLEIPKEFLSQYDKEFASTCLIYAYLIDADKIDINLKKYTELYIPRVFNFFKCSDEEFTYCMDLAHMYGCNIIDLLNRLGLSLPTPEKMISTANGVFSLYTKMEGNEYCDYILYLTSSAKSKNALPVFLQANKFIEFLQSGLDSKIVYKDDEPYIGNDCLVNCQLLEEVFG